MEGGSDDEAPLFDIPISRELLLSAIGVRSRLVSDSTTRDVEWELIEEERLEEPKEGWMLGKSKKRSTRISSRMLIVGLVPRSRVTLVKASETDELLELEGSRFTIDLVPLVMRRCLRFVGKQTTMNARSRRSTKVDESKLCDIPVVYTKSKKEHELHLKMNLELLKKEKCHMKPNKVKRSEEEAFRKLDGGWSYLRVVIVRPSTIWERANVVVNAWSDVRTLIMEEAHATKYSVRLGVNETVARHGVHVSSIPDKDGMYIETDGQSERTFRTLENMFRACVRNLVVVGILTFREAEIGESKMIGLELEQETTKVVVIKERLKEAKDRVVRFGKKGELAPRYIGPFEILERIGPVAYQLRLPDELSIGSYLSGVKISSKPEIALIFFKRR
ncbi:hypothetical protein Tco_1029731 [Tanacetum coccineum]|uniref:Tf2-1-like SH3-like domain-containing protein n=1 Tax=Tanacetum coccineum TaxID=301880 RepID=A0ABQ5G477_9ASTR